MNKVYTLLHLFLLLWGTAYAQAIDVSAIEKSGYRFINPNVQYLELTAPASLHAVQQPDFQKHFVPVPNTPVLFKGYNDRYYWYRFTLTNTDTSGSNLVLLLGQLGIHDAELWQGKNGNWSSLGKTGYQYPFQSRPYPFVHYAYPVFVPARTTDTVYAWINESHAYKTVAFALVTPDAMKRFSNRFYFSFGLMLGLLLLFILNNLYLYWSLRERIHIWYSLYMLLMLFLLIKHEGLDAEFLHLDFAGAYRSTSMAAFGGLGIGVLMHVVQQFLVNIPAKSILFRVTALTKWTVLGSAVLQLLIFYIEPNYRIEQVVFEMCNKTVIIGFVLILTNCIYSLFKGFKPALFLLVGWSVFLIGGLSRALFITATAYLFPPSLFEVGLVAEAVIISFGLMYRYQVLKQQKDALSLELERQQAVASTGILLAQEAERKRIAQDLHDELGGNLAALKMNLQSLALEPGTAAKTIQLIDQASENTRRISHNLMPPEFETTSLHDLLQAHFQRLSMESSTVFEFYYNNSNTGRNKDVELIIYRIILELTSNILRHAQATEATVQLIGNGAFLEIMVEDNGIGFGEITSSGIGLANVQSRVHYLNGSMHIDTTERGTTITIQLPLKPEWHG